MAYVTSAEQRRHIKEAVFDQIAPGEAAVRCGVEMYRVRGSQVHARYCAPGSGNYKFNLNPNTLRADFELWICGTLDHWYLIPVQVIQQMYEHPAAYRDPFHPESCALGVDPVSHRARYARPSVTLDLTPYFAATLP